MVTSRQIVKQSQIIKKSQIIKQSQIANKFFTVDVVSQLAGLVQIDDMGDEEVEHVVTSLASLTTKIKT